jgi:hypothetical protein
VVVMLMAFFFNILNEASTGTGLRPCLSGRVAFRPALLGGAALFLCGLAVNLHSDAVLRGLRQPGERSTASRSGGSSAGVQCPLSRRDPGMVRLGAPHLVVAGLAFALFTIANLHRGPVPTTAGMWRPSGVPPRRRVLVPFLY